jgi:hypothetical protein
MAASPRARSSFRNSELLSGPRQDPPPPLAPPSTANQTSLGLPHELLLVPAGQGYLDLGYPDIESSRGVASPNVRNRYSFACPRKANHQLRPADHRAKAYVFVVYVVYVRTYVVARQFRRREQPSPYALRVLMDA